MATLTHREILAYVVDIFESTSATHDRAIRLDLAGAAPSVVSLRFGDPAPADFIISIDPVSWTVHLSEAHFKDVWHLLQTESPVYFTAYEFDDSNLRFAGFTTDPEATGEGFRDDDLP